MVYFQQSVYEAFLKTGKPFACTLPGWKLWFYYKFFSEWGVIFFYYKSNIKETKEKVKKKKENNQFYLPISGNQKFFFSLEYLAMSMKVIITLRV